MKEKAPQRTVFVLLRACVVRKPAINVQISRQYIPKPSLEIASFSALKSCNTMDWPSGAVITTDLFYFPLVCALWMCIDAEIVTDI